MSKIKKLSLIFLPLIFLFFTGIAKAQYLGPGEMKADTTVAQIMKKPIDGQQVLLKGKITQRFGKKYYEFKDNTGTIRVKISEKLFYNQKVTENSVVELFGEVDQFFMETPIVKVFHLTVIKP